MPSLLVIIFALELAVQVINTIGAATLNNLLWTLFLSLPTELSRGFAKQRTLQQEYLKVRRDLNSTSSQDEFAKWAKLRRQHDKLLEELEKKKKSQDASRAKFDTYVTGARLVLTRGLQYFLPFWYSREPMFWLPHGWFPYYAEWVLSFPRAPLGSVSITSWQLACTGVIALLNDTAVAVWALLFAGAAASSPRREQKQQQQQQQQQEKEAIRTVGAGAERKREL